MSHIIPIRDLRKCAEISKLCKESKAPVFITKNGYGDMVLMSMETYETLLRENELVALIEEAEAAINNGSLSMPAKEVFKELREKYGV